MTAVTQATTTTTRCLGISTARGRTKFGSVLFPLGLDGGKATTTRRVGRFIGSAFQQSIVSGRLVWFTGHLR
jgi:hypothetical protein